MTSQNIHYGSGIEEVWGRSVSRSVLCSRRGGGSLSVMESWLSSDLLTLTELLQHLINPFPRVLSTSHAIHGTNETIFQLKINILALDYNLMF